MGLYLENLDETTRRYMLEEFEHDLRAGVVYESKWFADLGRREYPDLCREAIRTGSDETLAVSLSSSGMFLERHEKRTPSGGTTWAAVPRTAPVTFAEGEFNRLYLRGLCARLINEGVGSVELYRARSSAHPRPESEALIGSTVSPVELLEDLRASPGVDTALGLPAGPNSGMSGRAAPGAGLL